MSGRTKYRNQITVTEYGRFDSKGEARRYAELLWLQKAGEIADLRRQVPVYLEGRDGAVRYPNGRAARVVLDFAYVRDGEQVYEDFKGRQTDKSKLQQAVLRAQGVNVEIVK